MKEDKRKEIRDKKEETGKKKQTKAVFLNER